MTAFEALPSFSFLQFSPSSVSRTKMCSVLAVSSTFETFTSVIFRPSPTARMTIFFAKLISVGIAGTSPLGKSRFQSLSE